MSTQAHPSGGLIEDAERFLRSYYDGEIKELASKYPNEQRSLYIDWTDIYRYDPELSDDVIAETEHVRQHFEEALRTYDLPIDAELPEAHVRFENLPEGQTYDIGEFSPSRKHGELIAITGQVAKKTDVAPAPVEIAYECQLCGTLTRVPQSGTGFEEPHECQGCERQGPFKENADESEMVDYQKVRVKQPPEQTSGGDGQHLDVRLRDDLVDCVDGGDRVTIAGNFLLERPPNSSEKETFEMVVEGQAAELEQTEFKEVEITDDLKDLIFQVADGEYGDPIDVFINSIAPTLHGLDEEKEALALALVSGVRAENDDGTETRGDIHVLMIGDPGTGKTTLLETINEIAPRSVSASGRGASVAGMTAAAVRDEFGDGQWALDAGALVVGDQGIATIDEIDKLQENVEEALHDAMASQKVSVNKAGINTTLRSRTTVIAGGNPKYGRFDKYEPVSEQIEIGPTLFSRFDLTFTLQDQPEEDRDRTIAEAKIESKEEAKRPDHATDGHTKPQLAKISEENGFDKLELIRAFIAYAKRNVNPTIEDDAVAQKIEDSYVALRLANGTDDDAAVPITARKLDAFHRLAEASARLRLSDTVEIQDVMRAKRLIGNCLRDIGLDEESGEFDADIVETGNSKSQRERKKKLRQLIHDNQKEYDFRAVPINDLVADAVRELEVSEKRIEEDIDELKQKGDVYNPPDVPDESLRAT